MALLTGEPLDLGALVAEVVGPDRGAVVTFLGLVRDRHEGRGVLRLRYSAYPDMAEAEATVILGEAARRWPVQLAARHRTGMLEVGEAAVAVAVAGAHRGEAFEACRYVIEELKRRVPIWKQEYYADGSVGWVEPTP